MKITKDEYQVFLRDYRWLNRKNYIKALRGSICMNCGSTKILHIHHLHYSGKYPWNAPDEDLICLCSNCHAKAHNSELTNLETLIEAFNKKENDINRVLCFKKNKYIGNFLLETIEDTFKLSEKRVINCCNGETKTCGGYIWKYPKIGQSIESFKTYRAPKSTMEYIKLTMGKLYNKNLSQKLTPLETKFINSISKQKSLSMKKKIQLIKIVNRLNT